MSNATDNWLDSPVGEIEFMAVNKKVTKSQDPDAPTGYTVKLKFDTTNKDDAKWKETIKTLNKACVVTDKEGYTDTQYNMRAFTLYDVPVYDLNGVEMTEKPNFYSKRSKGTASITIAPYQKPGVTGKASLNLIAVTIHSLETEEDETGAVGAEGDAGAARRAALEARIRANLKKGKK